jgi:Flp pilus assembly pilin Flp
MVSNISRWLRKSRDAHEGGQALVEYTLLLMFVALVAVTALQTIGLNILGPLTTVANGVGGA